MHSLHSLVKNFEDEIEKLFNKLSKVIRQQGGHLDVDSVIAFMYKVRLTLRLHSSSKLK